MADRSSVCEFGEKSVAETSSYFSAIVELIPAKFYVQNDTEGDVRASSGKKKKLKAENKKLLSKKAKLLKLDPSKHKSISELQQEVEKKEKELLLEANDENEIKPIKISSIPSASIEELREKLHAKMVLLRGKRKLMNDNDKANFKKARIDNKEKDNKKKKKLKENVNIKRANEVEEKSLSNGKITNDRGEVVFSKFDFAAGAKEFKKKKKKDMKKLLYKAEKTQENIENLSTTDAEKAKELKQKIAWDNAVKRAEGVKLKDDPKLLKKSIKRKEKMKEKSAKQWKERTETVDKQKLEKQKLRKEHLKERRDEKGNKKRGSIKKKKSRPGF